MKRIQVKLYTEKQLYGREGQGRFFAVWRQGGRRKSHPLGAVSRDKAVIDVAAIEEGINAGHEPTSVKSTHLTFEEASEAMLAIGLEREKLARTTRETYAAQVKVMRQHFGDRPMDQIDEDFLESYYKKHLLPLGRYTIRNYLITLSKVFQFYNLDQRAGLTNPVPAIRQRFKPRHNTHTALARKQGSHAKPVAPEELPLLLEAAKAYDPDFYLYVLLGVDAGLRFGEMRALPWEDVYLGKNRTDPRRHIHVTKNLPGPTADVERDLTVPKWASIGRVEMSMRLHDALAERKESSLAGGLVVPSAWNSTEFRLRLHRLCKRHGLTTCRPKDLRDTYASYLFSLGVPPGYVASQLRHQDMETTLRHYARFMPTRYIVPPQPTAGQVPADFIALYTNQIAESMSDGTVINLPPRA